MSAVDPQDSFLTVAEVAETLKLNQQTVRNWIDQGLLPALRVGRRVRIKRSDFERILERSYTGGASAAPPTGPSAADFWGGEPVGVAEPAPEAPVGRPPGTAGSPPGTAGSPPGSAGTGPGASAKVADGQRPDASSGLGHLGANGAEIR